MNCSHCGKQMQQARHQGVVLDQCTGDGGCGGIWLDGDEIQQIQKASAASPQSSGRVSAEQRANFSPRKDGSHLPCPKCKTQMLVYQFAGESGVSVDRCPKGHGLWLESAELEAITRFAQKNARTAISKNQSNSLGRCCPRDGGQLSELTYEDQHLDQCTVCFGVWCDDEELKTIVNLTEVSFSDSDHPEISAKESRAKIVPEIDLVADLCCVTCHQPMRRSNYAYTSGIIIDRCKAGHGLWLDKDELEKIQVFIERSKAGESSVKAKFAPILAQAANEASKSLDEALRKKTKRELTNEKAASPLFDVLANGVDYGS